MKKLSLPILVGGLYLTLLLFFPEMGHKSLGNTWYYIKEMIEIMPVILVLTALIDVWVPKSFIEAHLGDASGIKGNIMSILLGSISAGPIYAAFPVSLSLLKKGTSIENIVIIISAWAVVKIPMLANEAKFLGLKFMSIRWLCTVIAIVIMGRLAKRLVTKSEVLDHMKSRSKDSKNKTPVKINQQVCVKCMVCVKSMPEIFERHSCVQVRSNVDHQFVTTLDALCIEKLEKTKLLCPVRAIEINLAQA